jgi:tetratricopeptide (TPR) repeat protein
MKKCLLLLCLFQILSGRCVYAQTRVADSLLALIRTDKADTNKVNHLNLLAIELWGNLDTAIICSSNALSIAKKIGWEKGTAKSSYLLGVFNFDKGNFPKALSCNMDALKIWEQLEKTSSGPDLQLVLNEKTRSIGEIGNAYYGLGNYPLALEYQLQALKMHEKLKQEKGVGNTYGNIGNIYYEQKNYPKALEYYLKSLKTGEKLGNKNDQSLDLRNISIVYSNMGNTSKALEYALMALVVSKQLKNDLEMANNLCCVGSSLQNQADSLRHKGAPYSELEEQYDKAMDYFQQSLKLDNEQGNQFGASVNYANIGGLLVIQKKYGEAEKYLQKALALDSALGSLSQVKYSHEILSNLYFSMGDYKRSLEHYKAFTQAKDSLFSEEKDKEITRHELNYEFEKKEAELKAEQDKKEALAEADKKRQNILFWLISSVAFAVALIAVIVFRALRVTRQQKLIIQQQKETVEEKQREVLDSIRYAKRIQKSLFPTEKYIDKSLDRLKNKE